MPILEAMTPFMVVSQKMNIGGELVKIYVCLNLLDHRVVGFGLSSEEARSEMSKNCERVARGETAGEN